MTPEDPPVPDDDNLAVAARGALGRLAGPGGAPAPWDDVRARGRRVRVMRYATVAAACLLVVLAGVGTVSAVNGGGAHIDVAGFDPGGSTTTTTTEPSPSTTTAPPAVTNPTDPTPGPTTPVVIPTFPRAQPGDFEGSIQVESTTLVATEPMPVTLTLRNITDHVVWVASYPAIGVYLGFFSATGMTEPDTLLAPGQTRTYTSTITANPALIGNTRLSAAYVRGVTMDFGTIVDAYLAGVPPIDVTVVPPGWEPGQPLDPSQGSWNVELSSDADRVGAGDSFVVHAQFTNTGTESQPTYAYGALALQCGDDDGVPMVPLTLAPGDRAALDLTVVATGSRVRCRAGVMFPTYDGHAVGDFAGATSIYPFPGLTSTPLTVPVTGERPTATTAPSGT